MEGFGAALTVCLFVLVVGKPTDPVAQLEQLNSKVKSKPKHIQSLETGYFESVQVPFWPSPYVIDRLGQVAGVGASREGNLYLFQRGEKRWEQGDFDEKNRYTAAALGPIQESTILVFPNDLENGNVIDQFGENRFYLPHGLTIDHEDNVWVTDVALHQIMKFPRGRREPTLVLGEKFAPGSDNHHFCKPTSVAVAKNGDFFVADGYCNSRIMKFSKDGKLKKEWGRPSNNDDQLESDELSVPHQLALIEEMDTICVADREHERVVCYDAGLASANKTGNFKFAIKDNRFGLVYGVAYNPSFNTLLILGGVTETVPASDVYVYDLKANKIIDQVAYSGYRSFGTAHSLAACPVSSCFLVGGLTKECPDDPALCVLSQSEEYQARNIWLYGLMDRQSELALEENLEEVSRA